MVPPALAVHVRRCEGRCKELSSTGGWQSWAVCDNGVTCHNLNCLVDTSLLIQDGGYYFQDCPFEELVCFLYSNWWKKTESGEGKRKSGCVSVEENVL